MAGWKGGSLPKTRRVQIAVNDCQNVVSNEMIVLSAARTFF